MGNRTRTALSRIGSAAFGLWALVFVIGHCPLESWAQSLPVADAKQRIASLAGLGKLDEKLVRIKSLDIGVWGRDAMVVAQVETAFKMTRVAGDWQITEVRVAPGQWENVDLVREAITREKERRTAEDLHSMKSAAEAFRDEIGSEPTARNIAELGDLLTPRYLARLIRFDSWGHELRIESTKQGLRIFSAGYDGRYGTKDDLSVDLSPKAR